MRMQCKAATPNAPHYCCYFASGALRGSICSWISAGGSSCRACALPGSAPLARLSPFSLQQRAQGLGKY
jgi:hypothetical protein